MRKRAALARALALEARIVIIDDFDSGIDGVRLALLCELIQDVQRRTGATFLVTTHDMASARKLADHVGRDPRRPHRRKRRRGCGVRLR